MSLRPTPEIPYTKISEQAVVLGVHMHRLGNSVTIDTKARTAADEKMIHVSKDLLDSPEARAIDGPVGRFKTTLRRRLALPSPLKGSHFVVPLSLVPKVMDLYREADMELEALKESFKEMYPRRVAEARERLKEEFDPADYPEMERVAEAFHLELVYLAVESPEALKKVSEDLYLQEKARFTQMMRDSAVECRYVLREGLAELVTHMVARLADDENGNRKRLATNLTQRLEEFFETFAARNLTDDGELSKLVEKARALTKGVDVELLKDNDSLRKRVRGEFQSVKAVIDKMVEDRPARSIKLDDY